MIEASIANVVTPKASTPPSTDMDRALDPSSGGAIDPSKWRKYNYESGLIALCTYPKSSERLNFQCGLVKKYRPSSLYLFH